MKKAKQPFFTTTALLFILFLISILKFDIIENVLILLIKPKSFFLARVSLFEIAKQHILIVIISSSLSIIIALTISILTRFPFMNDFEEFLLGLATFGQTIPTVAILALLVPFLGYGFKPALFALFVYGFLPVLRNTIEGFNTIPEEIRESARAMGMNRFQIITKVELPLALPAILAGIRISLILNISVATIGATVGLSGFGTLIVNGIRSDDTIMILKGAIPVSLLALAVESLFINLEKRFRLPVMAD
jgi:osmoprotectant transport system permease protein